MDLSYWFALTDNSEIMCLGQHDGIDSADEVAPPGTIWLYDEDALRELRTSIDFALRYKESLSGG